MANQRDELLTVAQVLAVLGDVSLRTFYRWRETGKAPGCPAPQRRAAHLAQRSQHVAGPAPRTPPHEVTT